MARFSAFFPFLEVHHCALAFALLFGATSDSRDLLAAAPCFGLEHMALAGRFITWGVAIGGSLEGQCLQMGNPVALTSNLHQCFDTATHVTVLHTMLQSMLRSVPFLFSMCFV